MKKLSITLALLLTITMGFVVLVTRLKAQTSPSGLGLTSTSGLHTTCVAVSGAVVTICGASDGLAEAIGTGSFTLIPTSSAPAGVTSFNGRTGAVVPIASDYPDAVQSVNGKTGAVIINATTTLQ